MDNWRISVLGVDLERSSTEVADLVEDFVGGFRPNERLTLLVVNVDVVQYRFEV